MTDAGIFEVGYAFDAVTSFALTRADAGFYNRFDGRALAAAWAPPAVQPADVAEDDARLGDVAPLGTVPVVSQRAVDALAGLPLNVEFLPVLYPRRRMYILNVLAVQDCLSESAEVERFPTGRVMRITRFAFRTCCLSGTPLFRIPELLRGHLFATHSFVDTAAQAGLIGFEFTRLWPPSP